jgi:hypothetical protein
MKAYFFALIKAESYIGGWDNDRQTFAAEAIN